MDSKPSFQTEHTHGVLQRFGAQVAASSDGLGWNSVYASTQRERPFDGHFQALRDSLMVLHRGGPVNVTFKMDGRPISRQVPKGGIFFLPAGLECDVRLHAPLETTHIYLRSGLFASAAQDLTSKLAPVFGERDPILERLGEAIGEAVGDAEPTSSLFVDPIAVALANRFIALNCRAPARRTPGARLTDRQLRLVRDYAESRLQADIRLEALAGVCGLSTDYFVRQFKASVGVSPYQFVLSLRIERAQRLLRDGQESLAEIALRCGFTHQEHMTRMFRRRTGVTPGRYRRDRL